MCLEVYLLTLLFVTKWPIHQSVYIENTFFSGTIFRFIFVLYVLLFTLSASKKYFYVYLIAMLLILLSKLNVQKKLWGEE